ncbi:HK97 gp10 family phage protein [Ensifer sp.]|jgi:hypothetical protein|uniref:HK97 gp10 family phage protein n=1 Tax=Ensifer sp. TaxID=1872086 RepID=UPI002E15C29F|nr:HK97 gp10 family phage protein [Ensifer sp.]
MALKTKILGREALTKKLNEIAPSVEKYAAPAKLEIAEEAADKIAGRAPTGATLEYMHNIEAGRLADHPDKKPVGINASKDPSAAGVFAPFIWRFLEFGTAPHNTAPGGGTVLGQVTHAEGGGTQHPGTAAQPHIFPTWREMRDRAKRKIQAAVNKGVKEAMSK